MRRQFYIFLIRWALNSLGIWVAIRLFGVSEQSSGLFDLVATFIFAGFIFSVINSILRPMIVILSLPVILLTLGLFTLMVNGLMVYLSLKLSPGLEMSFGDSILAGIVMSLVNYIVSSVVDQRENTRNQLRSE